MNKSLKDIFSSLHKEYYNMVLHLCTGFMKGDREQATDLAQEVFINTWNALEKFKGASSYKTWIYRITVNTCLQFIRQQKNKKTEQLDDISVVSLSLKTVPTEEDRYNHLYWAIGTLSEADRLLIMMVLEELEYTEIRSVLGISDGTLRVKIHRIKQRLKKIMNHE